MKVKIYIVGFLALILIPCISKAHLEERVDGFHRLSFSSDDEVGNDDEGNDDDGYDIDGGTLDGVTVTGHNDNGDFDDNFWSEHSHSYSYHNDNYDANNGFHGGGGSGINHNNTTGTNYHKPAVDEVDISDKLPTSFIPQNAKMNCVSTVLEYVDNYLNNTLTSNYVYMRNTYQVIGYADLQRDVLSHGVLNEQMDNFIEDCGFEMADLSSMKEIQSMIDMGIPVIGELSVRSNKGIMQYHEVFIVGYYTDDSSRVLTINPANGSYQDWNLSDFRKTESIKALNESKK